MAHRTALSECSPAPCRRFPPRVELAGGVEIIPTDTRFNAMPIPVVLHILSATVYTILGAFQFAPSFRRRMPRWHWRVGRLLVLSSLLVGLSALWMTLFYSIKDGTGELLYAFRLLFGLVMVVYRPRLYLDPA